MSNKLPAAWLDLTDKRFQVVLYEWLAKHSYRLEEYFECNLNLA